ncbi:MAG: super-infection exclusion protein B [Alphaproteobacteria bacterium]|nr:MAG: super-infection exclusion protein B [Alphaproteobacteria bacterium]
MEWISLIWNKLNKPLHYLFVGAALCVFAPSNDTSDYTWTGYIFIAFGIAGAIEWGLHKAKDAWASHQQAKQMQQILKTLNADERVVMLDLVNKNTRTGQLNWDQYHGLLGRPEEFTHYKNVIIGLTNKGVLTASHQGKSVVYHIPDNVRKIIDRKQEIIKPVNVQKA